MICCRECLDLLYDYLEGHLEPKVHDSLKEHLEDCPPCISFLNTYKSTTSICKESLKKDIPDMVQTKLQEFLKENIKRD